MVFTVTTWDDSEFKKFQENDGEGSCENDNFMAFKSSVYSKHSKCKSDGQNSVESVSDDDSESEGSENGNEEASLEDLNDTYNNIYKESVKLAKKKSETLGKIQA